MADDSTASTGETPESYLENLRPKDLVMFSESSRRIIAKVNFIYESVIFECMYTAYKLSTCMKQWWTAIRLSAVKQLN